MGWSYSTLPKACLPGAYPMPRQSLTPSFVARAKVNDGAERNVSWDTALPGVGLVVTSKGARSFVVQYRNGGRGSQGRRMKISREGEAITLTDARKEARRLLVEADRGADPLA